MATLERREQTPGQVTYRVRWWADGKQRSKSFKSYADAKRWRAVLEGDMVNGSFIDPKHGQMTLSAFVRDHSEALLIDVRVSTSTRIAGIYRTHVLPEFGHLPLSGITTAAVAKWVNQMRSSLGASSVRKNVFALRRLMDLAVSYGLIRSNPVVAVKLPVEPKHEQKFLTHSQAWTLADAINPRYRAMVLVAVFGGLRFGELCALRRVNVIPERNLIVVRQTAVDVKGDVTFGPPKTRTSIRTVTIPRSIMAELVAHMDTYTAESSDSLLFTGKRRGDVVRRGWFYRAYWLPTTEKAGMEGLRFHDLRHTFVALWVHAGRSVQEVSKAAGHSSVAFTLDQYGHLYDTDSAALADELDALLGHIRPHTGPVAGVSASAGERSEPIEHPSGGGCQAFESPRGHTSNPAQLSQSDGSDLTDEGDTPPSSRTHQDSP